MCTLKNKKADRAPATQLRYRLLPVKGLCVPLLNHTLQNNHCPDFVVIFHLFFLVFPTVYVSLPNGLFSFASFWTYIHIISLYIFNFHSVFLRFTMLISKFIFITDWYSTVWIWSHAAWRHCLSTTDHTHDGGHIRLSWSWDIPVARDAEVRTAVLGIRERTIAFWTKMFPESLL